MIFYSITKQSFILLIFLIILVSCKPRTAPPESPNGCSLPTYKDIRLDVPITLEDSARDFFNNQCNRHDNCYGYGFATYLKFRDQCDLDFLKNMEAHCKDILNINRVISNNIDLDNERKILCLKGKSIKKDDVNSCFPNNIRPKIIPGGIPGGGGTPDEGDIIYPALDYNQIVSLINTAGAVIDSSLAIGSYVICASTGLVMYTAVSVGAASHWQSVETQPCKDYDNLGIPCIYFALGSVTGGSGSLNGNLIVKIKNKTSNQEEIISLTQYQGFESSVSFYYWNEWEIRIEKSEGISCEIQNIDIVNYNGGALSTAVVDSYAVIHVLNKNLDININCSK